MAPVDSSTAEHYVWGEICDGWHLLKQPALSVIQELVPAGAGEIKHFHSKAAQFFFILSGSASLEIDDYVIDIHAGQGAHIPAGIAHRFVNRTNEPVRFLVISSPSTAEDRTNLG